MVRKLFWLPVLLASGCWGRGDTGQRPDETDTVVIETGNGCNTGYGVSGVAWDIAADAPAAEGLCIHAADPTNALLGMDIEILVSNTVDAEGEFLLCGIKKKPDPGLLLVVNDCDPESPTIAQTSTGIAKEDYIDLRAGDMIPDRIAYVVSLGLREKISADLVTAGYDQTGHDADLTNGFVIGRVVDAQDNPLSDAVVTPACTACVPSYYFDSDPSDGYFTTGTTVNAKTSAAADGMWMNPEPFIANYSCTHPTETFTVRLFGSVSGNAGYLSMIANP